MKKLRVNINEGYDILIGENLLENCGKYMLPVCKGKKAVIVTDNNVGPLYAKTVYESLTAAGFSVSIFTFAAGESSKCLETISYMYDCFAGNGITREDTIVALGGGVAGDMAGFAAATYLRGINYVNLPTSLLAQTDSSVGGKTGVDIPRGKNLVGAFHQPKLVLCDINTLKTLPDAFFSDGMAECIKYGCIMDKALFEKLQNEDPKDFLQQLVFRCLDIKRQIVEQDEREGSLRKILNFGHTIGHALERYYNYTGLTHGQAVAIGMFKAAQAGEALGLTEKGTAQKIKEVLHKFKLPFEDNAPINKLVEFIFNDKKRKDNKIELVLLKEIGQSFIYSININKTVQFFGG